MKLSFLGAAKTVTGSCHLIQTENLKILVDCGMFQGKTAIEAWNEQPFGFNPSEIDYVLLTHAHIDHSGRIPKLCKEGFKGQIIATNATVNLCSIMLPDSGHIQEFETEWKNRKRTRAGKPLVEPLYTKEDADNSMKYFKSVKYDETVRLTENIMVRFSEAGHMLGSAVIEIWIKENDKESKLVFTGDLGNSNIPILRDPKKIEEADYLIIESTYGNRLHSDNKDKAEKFLNIVYDTIRNGGNVVIPSFAVGRTQEIIYELFKEREKYQDKINELIHTPVFVDSPLAISATEIFRQNMDCFDKEAREYIENGENPLEFPQLHFTRTADESRALNERKEPSIIISASGMCEAGRIKHHLKHNLWRKDCSIIFVGYQAQGTLGRKLVEGVKKVNIYGEEISVNARIEMIDGYSGHADQNGLINWMKGLTKKPERVFLVHGEEETMEEY